MTETIARRLGGRGRSLSPQDGGGDGDGDAESRQSLLPSRLDSSSSSSSSSSSPSSSSSSSSSESLLALPALSRLADYAKWGIASNALFLIGSVLQIIPAIWDLRVCRLYGDDDNAADDDDDESWTVSDYAHYYMATAGAMMYILNALADLAQARSEQSPPAGRLHAGGGRWEVWAALSFGAGAVLEFACYAVLGDDEEGPAYVATMIVSMHIYLLSGILALRGQGLRCRSCAGRCSSSSALVGLFMEGGAFLFLLGCLIDVSLSWLSNPQLLALSPTILAWGNLASTLTWLLDAVLYVSADCILYSLPRRLGRRLLRTMGFKQELPL